MSAFEIARVFLFGFVVMASSGAAETSLDDLVDRAFAEKKVIHSAFSAAEIEASIRKMADASLEKLKSGDESQKKTAARILGALRERRAIPLLVENIGLVEYWVQGESTKVGFNLDADYPACAALKNIGGPEVDVAVRKVIESNNLDDRTRMLAEALLESLK